MKLGTLRQCTILKHETTHVHVVFKFKCLITILHVYVPGIQTNWNNKFSDKTFEELVELMKKHYNPRPSVIVQRYKFHTRVRQAGESIADYLAALRTLSEYCEFRDGTLYEYVGTTRQP